MGRKQGREGMGRKQGREGMGQAAGKGGHGAGSEGVGPLLGIDELCVEVLHSHRWPHAVRFG